MGGEALHRPRRGPGGPGAVREIRERRLYGGAPYIERVDKLVQLVAKHKGRSSPVLDETVRLVDAQLEKNRAAQKQTTPS
jgi:hypothetical protein